MDDERRESAVDEAAAALARAVPRFTHWFTRGDVGRAMLADTDPALSRTDAWLLGRVTDIGPLRLSELAEWQEVDRSTMTTQVRRLETLGLVTRAPDPRDGRAVLVSATPAGVARHRRTERTARAVYHELLADWPEDDLRQAAHASDRLAETLERRASTPFDLE